MCRSLVGQQLLETFVGAGPNVAVQPLHLRFEFAAAEHARLLCDHQVDIGIPA
jgi:hypothetical protein